jgi:uncharacterized protein YhdP
MRSFRWLFITGAVVVILAVLAIAIGSVWLNSFIHSDAFRHEVEARAGQTLGGTVQIDRIDFNIFTGVKLSGLATQIDPSRVNGQGALLAKVESVDCTYALGNLLHRELKLTGITLEKPQIVLTRQPASTVVTPPAPSDAPETGENSGSGGAAPFQFVLDGAKVHDGGLSVRDVTGASLADLQGIEVAADTAGYYEGKDVTGKLNVDNVELPSNLHLTDFSTPFTYHAGGGVEAKPLQATAFGGNLAGDFELGPGGPSLLEVNAKGLDVAQISSVVNTTSSARLSGSLDLQSKWQGVETGAASGEGDAQLTDGKLQGVAILTQLAGVLRIKELNDPILRKVQTHFQVANGRTRFTGLQIDGGAFQMTGDGVIAAGGALDANMVLILTADAMGRMPKEASGFFVQKPDGSGSIGFHIGGTASNPQTDLVTRLFIQNMQIQNVVSKALNGFFHKHKKQQNQAPPPDPNLAPPPDATPAQPSGPVQNPPAGP